MTAWTPAFAGDSPWGIDVSGMDPATAAYVRNIGYGYQGVADSGRDPAEVFREFLTRKNPDGSAPTGAEIQQFANFLSTSPADLLASRFGKYSEAETRGQNYDQFLSGDADPSHMVALQGSGGWLGDHLGDAFRVLTNPLDAATGGWLGDQMGRLGANIYNETAGNLGGWMGDHVFGDTGALSGITRGLNAYSVGALTPGTLAPIESGANADYQQRRDAGQSAQQALGGAVADGATIAATAASGGALSGLGALASTGINAGLGATAGAANAYGSGGNIGRGALTGAAGSLGSLAGLGTTAALGGGTAGTIAGNVVGGAANGAIRSGLNGQNIGQGAAMGAISGLGGGAGGATGIAGGSQFGSLLAGLLNHQLFSPSQPGAPPPQANTQFPLAPGNGGFSFQPGLLQTATQQQSAPVPGGLLDPAFQRLYGATQAQQLMRQIAGQTS